MSSTQPVSYQVFLSYSSEDLKWATSVCRIIEQRNIRCWMAPRDIAPGTEWGAAIVDGIDRCRIMVLVFSAHANSSAQVRREVERAVSKGLALLPVRIEDVRPQGAMEYALSNTHWLDAFTPPATQQLAHLADAVQALLGQTPPSRDTVAETSSGDRPARPKNETSASSRISTRGVLGGIAVLLMGLVVTVTVFAALKDSSATVANHDRKNSDDDDYFAVPDSLHPATHQYQGRWVAFYLHLPDRGPVPVTNVMQNRVLWIIKGNELEIQFSPVPGKNATIRGRIFMFEGEQQNQFGFRCVDEQGNRQAWLGIYEFDGEVLSVCYRIIEAGRGLEARPDKLPNPEDRGVWFLKLRRARRPMAP